MNFWDRKSQNRFFFKFFITKSPDFISNLNDNCSQLSFEVYNVCVAQKLRISEFLINFLSPGTWPLRRPPEAAISTSATSIGYQILAKDLNFHMRLCLLQSYKGKQCVESKFRPGKQKRFVFEKPLTLFSMNNMAMFSLSVLQYLFLLFQLHKKSNFHGFCMLRAA